ncbi:MAG: hypothetical protein J6C13_04795 [Clostridia bacterium]|nr:hypothetical protein [Clostridia bacterium]
MSFFSGIRTEQIPGPIVGNPLRGLCEKVCIQVKKVFDACLKQQQITNTQIQLENFVPANPALPLTFVSGQSSTTIEPTLTDVTITRFEDRPNFAHISAIANVPIEIVYTDANNVQGVATGTVSLPQDVVLFLPQASIVPFRVEVVASAIIAQGVFDGTIITVDGCVMLIIKIVAETELLVPSYGYCHIPQCQEFSTNVCQGFFEMPLFPSNNPIVNVNEN